MRASVCDRPSDGFSPTRPAGIFLLADVNEAVEESAGRQHHAAGRAMPAIAERDTRYPAVPDRAANPRRHPRRSPDPAFPPAARRRPGDRACGRPGRAARAPPPLAAVQDAELDARPVDRPAHDAVERIDLAHEMALAEPADRRIARHLADRRPLVRSAAASAPRAAPPPRPPRSRHARRRPRRRRSARSSCSWPRNVWSAPHAVEVSRRIAICPYRTRRSTPRRAVKFGTARVCGWQGEIDRDRTAMAPSYFFGHSGTASSPGPEPMNSDRWNAKARAGAELADACRSWVPGSQLRCAPE